MIKIIKLLIISSILMGYVSHGFADITIKNLTGESLHSCLFVVTNDIGETRVTNLNLFPSDSDHGFSIYDDHLFNSNMLRELSLYCMGENNVTHYKLIYANDEFFAASLPWCNAYSLLTITSEPEYCPEHQFMLRYSYYNNNNWIISAHALPF